MKDDIFLTLLNAIKEEIEKSSSSDCAESKKEDNVMSENCENFELKVKKYGDDNWLIYAVDSDGKEIKDGHLIEIYKGFGIIFRPKVNKNLNFLLDDNGELKIFPRPEQAIKHILSRM